MMHQTKYLRFSQCSSGFVLCLVIVGLTGSAFADYAIVRHTIDGGGVMTSSGGAYKLSGTIGQHDAGVLAGGSYVLTGGFWQAATATVPEPLGSTGEAAQTNRYLRFVVPAGESRDEVIRVRFVSLDGFPVPDPDVLYIGPPTDAPEEESAQPGLTFRVTPLVCTPYTHDWSGEGIVSVYGAEIMPGSVYEVQRAGADCADLADEACWSTPLQIRTAKYGDVSPVFDWENVSPQPDFNDVAAMVNKFLATAGAPIKAVAQLQPNSVFPDRPIDFRDIAADVEGFLGTPFASTNHGPCVCPPTVTCNETACSSKIDCVGFGDGLCVNGSCADPCGRCAP